MLEEISKQYNEALLRIAELEEEVRRFSQRESYCDRQHLDHTASVVEKKLVFTLASPSRIFSITLRFDDLNLIEYRPSLGMMPIIRSHVFIGWD